MKITNGEDLSWFKTYLDQKKGGNIAYVPTNYHNLNDLIDGFYRGTLITIGARPSIGKTTLSLNLVNQLYKSHKCLVFSTEDTKEKLIEKLISMQTTIPHKEIRTHVKERYDEIIQGMESVKSRNLEIVDISNPSIIQVEDAIKMVQPRFVVFDYFQNISIGTNDKWSSAGIYATIVQKMASLARDHKLTFILLSQLKRFGDDDTRPPRLSDLKETGKLEEASHVVMLLRQTEEGMVVDVAKNREGPKGEVTLRIMKDCGVLV